MAWSGTTKYLRNIILVQGYPVEIPGIGVLVTKPANNDTSPRLTKDMLEKVVGNESEVCLIMFDKFLEDNGLQIQDHKQTLQMNSEEALQCDLTHIRKLNYASIAKVCETDLATVEMIHKEIHS